MTLDDDVVVAVWNGYIINPWLMTKNEAVDRVKNAYVSEKKWTTMITKLLIMAMSNNKQRLRPISKGTEKETKKSRRR